MHGTSICHLYSAGQLFVVMDYFSRRAWLLGIAAKGKNFRGLSITNSFAVCETIIFQNKLF